MDGFTEALIFAAEAHDGQTYGDLPYIAHPMGVAVALLQAGGDEVEVQGALLHDSIEDCSHVSFDMVRARFGDEVAQVVIGLTHPDGMGYEEYVDQMPARSRRVKFFDSLGNYKGLFSPHLRMSEEKKDRLAARYKRNLTLLYPEVYEMALSIEDRLLVERLVAEVEAEG